MEESALIKLEEEATSSLRARDMVAPVSLGSLARNFRKMMMVVHLDLLAFYQ